MCSKCDFAPRNMPVVIRRMCCVFVQAGNLVFATRVRVHASVRRRRLVKWSGTRQLARPMQLVRVEAVREVLVSVVGISEWAQALNR